MAGMTSHPPQLLFVHTVGEVVDIFQLFKGLGLEPDEIVRSSLPETEVEA